MGLKTEKIEHLDRRLGKKSHSRKYLKNQRNRKLRRTKQTEVPETKKFKGHEY